MLTLVALSLAGLLAVLAEQHRAKASAAHDAGLQRLLDQRQAVRPDPPCAVTSLSRPRTLLVLGQSNAGNHGEAQVSPMSVDLIVERGECRRTTAPLPGATGRGDALWPRVNALLEPEYGPLRWSLLALDATSIEDWSRPESPIYRALAAQLRALEQAGSLPTLVLWQQGEADARLGTSRSTYLDGLLALSQLLLAANVPGPMLLAKSTVCRSLPDATIREAIDEAVARWPARFRHGADTDTLTDPEARHDGCHFSAAGLDRAARLWADVVRYQLVERRP